MNSSRLQNYTIYYNNSDEYHRIKKEVFTTDTYYFESENPNPFIIDAGAHIGLATLYFKQLFKGAEIIAIEPNPSNFEILETNLFENQIDDVTTVQAALSNQYGKESLYFDATDEEWYSTSSFHPGAWSGVQTTTEISVPTYTLSEFVTKPVDFLKMDIEGAEQKVLIEARDVLHLIKEMHIEFHTHPTQSLPKLIELLEKTHKVEFFKGTKTVPLRKATGLVHIHAVNRK